MKLILRIFLGLVGGACLLLALWVAGREATALAGGAHRFIPLGQVWFEVDAASLNMTQAGIQRHIAPWLWDDAVQPLLEQPAWPVLAALGLALLWALLRLRPRGGGRRG